MIMIIDIIVIDIAPFLVFQTPAFLKVLWNLDIYILSHRYQDLKKNARQVHIFHSVYISYKCS